MVSRQQTRSTRIDSWLAGGGIVLAASDRAARAIQTAYNTARRAQGLTAWTSPAIAMWQSWVREQWQQRDTAGHVPLSALQERALWAEVIRASRHAGAILDPDRLAGAAQRALRLLCDYAPDALVRFTRSGWAGDSAIFSEWLAAFDTRCRRHQLISLSRLGLELTAALSSGHAENRSPLLLIGFDRLTPSQRALLTAWGPWQLDFAESSVTPKTHHFAARDAESELAACVLWARQYLAADPSSRLMIVTPGLDLRRGEIERALLQPPPAGLPELRFEFSLGVSLASAGLARGALLLLRWLYAPLSEPELDWLISSGYACASPEEQSALAETMLQLRRRQLQRPDWPLEAFLNGGTPVLPLNSPTRPPTAFAARLNAARHLLRSAQSRQTPLAWAELTAELLETTGWPGYRPLTSEAFQSLERWESVVNECATLGLVRSVFDPSSNSDPESLSWPDFVSALSAAAHDTVFAAESSDPPLLITEPFESAGLLADGIWFLGASEDSWPSRGAPHGLLPIRLQRASGMPHATPADDADLAASATQRLLASASESVFSHARHTAGVECRPSRLITRLAGPAVPLPESLIAAPPRPPITERCEDASLIPLPRLAIEGGAGTLTNQSLCPFKAFAVSRLAAQDWQPAGAGLTASERGLLLHAVLHRIWDKSSGGLGGLDDLIAIPDLVEFIRPYVRTAINEKPAWRETHPARYLNLEADRLTGLIAEWLTYESARHPFTVERAERKIPVTIAGATLDVRLDRVDRLHDRSLLVIDYKTGLVGPSVWLGDRPDDVQLPLYAIHAIPLAITQALLESSAEEQQYLQGLVFARLAAGNLKYDGRLRDARGTLHPGLGNRTAIVKNALTDEQLSDWRNIIQRLGEDYLAGHAEPHPKDGLKTCDRCHLHAVCRIYDTQSLATLEAAEDDADQALAQLEDAASGSDASDD
jgi:ATP-dependent helicase/nuclease subunit B